MKTAEHIRRLEVLEQELLHFHERQRATYFDMHDFWIMHPKPPIEERK